MSSKMKWFVAVLLVITCIVAVVHKNNQEEIPCMIIRLPDREMTLDFSDLDHMEFSGEQVDGKGTTTFHTYRGILLRDLLEMRGVAVGNLTITSADQYTVEFTAEEILEEDRVYAVISADGEKMKGIVPGTDGVQIVVFGDPDSRRWVRYASIIEMRP